MSKYKFSLITLGILILSSFIPVLHVFILNANGAFVSLFTSSDSKIILLVNSVASLFLFIIFYFSNSVAAKVFSVLGILLFFIPFLFYVTENLINTGRYYFLRFLIIGIIAGGVLFLIELLKVKIKAPD